MGLSKYSCPRCGRGLELGSIGKKFIECSCGETLHIKRNKSGRCKKITIVQRSKSSERR